MNKYFPVVLNGFGEGGMAAFKGEKILSLGWPKVQTIGGLWGFKIYWENGWVWRFENAPEMARMEDGLEFEVGTIVVEQTNSESERPDSEKTIYAVDDFVVIGMKVAIGCEGDVVSDCAISLNGKSGKELVVLTAVPPTTITFGVSGGPYPNSEFPLSSLEWRDIDEEFNPISSTLARHAQ